MRNHAPGFSIANSLDYLCRNQRLDGLWPSYWWISDLYSSYYCLQWLTQNAYEIPRHKELVSTVDQFYPSTAFEMSLYLGCKILLRKIDDSKVAQILREILDLQLTDGSWESYPMLRLTRQDLEKPWEVIDSGYIYRDCNRIFTTATIASLLERLRQAKSDTL